MDGASDTDKSNLIIVRHIIHIQALEKLKFNRVIYFLPHNAQTRADRAMQLEISNMIKFFGQSVFECMVLVGTVTRHISSNADITSEVKLPLKELQKYRQNFEDTLRREFAERQEDTTGLLIPPIIFIAMTDSCEDILHKIKSASITTRNSLLAFNSKTCCKCGIELGTTNTICEYRKPGAKPWTSAVPYEDSFCHPKIQSVYTLRSVLLGILLLVVLKWNFADEKCVYCKMPPGSKGCWKATKEFSHGNETIKVHHLSQLDK